MQGVLQSSSLACRGSLLQPAYTAPPQRLVPYSWFCCVSCQWQSMLSLDCCTLVIHIVLHILLSLIIMHTHICLYFFADLIDPLTYRPVYHQKYVLNERGKTLIQNKTKQNKTTFKLCAYSVLSLISVFDLFKIHLVFFSKFREQGHKEHALVINLFVVYLFPGPLFFLGCFSFAVGMALLYYYSGTHLFHFPILTLYACILTKTWLSLMLLIQCDCVFVLQRLKWQEVAGLLGWLRWVWRRKPRRC